MNVSKAIISEIESLGTNQPQPEKDDIMAKLMKLDPARYKVRIVTMPLNPSQRKFLEAMRAANDNNTPP